jgi:hypothetical protein
MNASPESCAALVLNADFRPLSYFPLSLWPWQESIKAVFLDRVNIVSQYDRIVSHGSNAQRNGTTSSANSAPSAEAAPNLAPSSAPADLPPWWTPDLQTHDGNDQDRTDLAPLPAPLPPEGPSRAAELGAGVLGALSRLPKGPVPGSGFAQAAAADEAAAFARINQAASPYLQSISPEFARAAELDRASALARIRGYATPALRAGAGEAALGLGPLAAGVAAGLAGGAALDAYGRYTQAKNKEFTSAVQPGEVSFSVDGGAPFDPYRSKKKAC